MKRYLLFSLLLLTLFILVGCNSSNDDNTICFNGTGYDKSVLSEETIAWIERYNNLTEEEQLSTSYIPHDLYELMDFEGKTEEAAEIEDNNADIKKVEDSKTDNTDTDK